MKFIRVALFVLIVLGLGALFTQSYWVPALVAKILQLNGDTPRIYASNVHSDIGSKDIIASPLQPPQFQQSQWVVTTRSDMPVSAKDLDYLKLEQADQIKSQLPKQVQATDYKSKYMLALDFDKEPQWVGTYQYSAQKLHSFYEKTLLDDGFRPAGQADKPNSLQTNTYIKADYIGSEVKLTFAYVYTGPIFNPALCDLPVNLQKYYTMWEDAWECSGGYDGVDFIVSISAPISIVIPKQQ